MCLGETGKAKGPKLIFIYFEIIEYIVKLYLFDLILTGYLKIDELKADNVLLKWQMAPQWSSKRMIDLNNARKSFKI